MKAFFGWLCQPVFWLVGVFSAVFSRFDRRLFHMVPGVIAIVVFHAEVSKSELRPWVWGYTMGVVFLDMLRLSLHYAGMSSKINRRFPKFRPWLKRQEAGLIEEVDENGKRVGKRRLLREKERHLPSSGTPYCVAILVSFELALLEVAVTSLFLLAFGDTMAGWAGEKWGRKKIWKEKTMVGFIGFVVAATVILTISRVLDGYVPIYTIPGDTLTIAQVSVVLVGALAELFGGDFDNATIVAAASITMSLFV